MQAALCHDVFELSYDGFRIDNFEAPVSYILCFIANYKDSISLRQDFTLLSYCMLTLDAIFWEYMYKF